MEILEKLLEKTGKISHDKWEYDCGKEPDVNDRAYTGTDAFDAVVKFGEDKYEIGLKRMNFFLPDDDCDSEWSECFFTIYSVKDNKKVFDVSHKECEGVRKAFYALHGERERLQQLANEEYRKKREVEESKHQEEKRKERMGFLDEHIPKLEKALEGD